MYFQIIKYDKIFHNILKYIHYLKGVPKLIHKFIGNMTKNEKFTYFIENFLSCYLISGIFGKIVKVKA